MAINLGTAYINISASTRGLKGDLAKGFGDAGRSAKGAGEAAGAQYGQGFAQKSEGFLSKVMGGVGVGIGIKVVDGLAGALKKVGDIAIGGGINRALNLENATASLKGLGHNAESVEKIMKSALGSVKGTAFGMGDAAQVAASAVAAGIEPGEKLQRTLTLVGDAATIAKTDMGSMGGIFNKVATSNKLQMDSVNQLHDAGIPVLQLVAKELGVTAEEASTMASKGKISFDTFQTAMEKGLGGAAQESGKTFEGAMANTKAALGRIAADFATPILNGMTGLFAGLIPVIDTLGAAVKPMAEAFGGWVEMQAPKVTAFLESVPGKLKEFGDVAKGVFDLVFKGDFKGGLFGLEEDSPVVDTIFRVRDGFLELAGLVQGGAAILFDGKFLGQGIMGLDEDAPLVNALFVIREKFVALSDWVVGVGVPAFQGIWESVTTNLQPVFEMLGKWITDVAIPAWSGIADIITSVAGPAFETVARVLSDVVLPILGGVAGFITEKIIPVVKRMVEEEILPRFRTVSAFLTEHFLPAFETVAAFIRDEVAPVVSDLADRVLIPAFERIGAIAGWLFDNTLMPQFASMARVLEEVVGPVIGWLWTDVVAPTFRNIGDAVESFGDQWHTIWTGLQSASARPVNFIIETVWNNGLRKALNMIPGVDLGTVASVPTSPGGTGSRGGGGRAKSAFHDGGYTGPGGKYEPAGIVHAGEYVFTQAEVAKMGGWQGVEELKRGLPGFANGGRVHPLSGGIGTSYPGHTGRDFGRSNGGAFGTPVKAAGDGVITAVRHITTSYGNHIRQRLDEGFGAVYAHLSSIGVSTGQRVAAGQYIGRVGNTGNSHGAHLHFGINESPAATVAFLRGAAVGKGTGSIGGGSLGAAGMFGEAAAPVETMDSLGIPGMIAKVVGQIQSEMTSPWAVMMKTGVLSIIDDLKKSILDKPLEAVKDFLGVNSKISKGESNLGDQFTKYGTGTGFARSGVHLAGENGAELIDFGRGGASVSNAERTADMLSASRARSFPGATFSFPGVTRFEEFLQFMEDAENWQTTAGLLDPAAA